MAIFQYQKCFHSLCPFFLDLLAKQEICSKKKSETEKLHSYPKLFFSQIAKIIHQFSP